MLIIGVDYLYLTKTLRKRFVCKFQISHIWKIKAIATSSASSTSSVENHFWKQHHHHHQGCSGWNWIEVCCLLFWFLLAITTAVEHNSLCLHMALHLYSWTVYNHYYIVGVFHLTKTSLEFIGRFSKRSFMIFVQIVTTHRDVSMRPKILSQSYSKPFKLFFPINTKCRWNLKRIFFLSDLYSEYGWSRDWNDIR